MTDEKTGELGSMGEQEQKPLRPKIQHPYPGSARTQVRDPLTGKRISITGPEHEVIAQAERIRAIRFKIRHNRIPVDQARKEIRQQFYGSPLVKEIWDQHVATYTDWGKQAASLWTHHLAPYFGEARIAELDEARMRAWEAAELQRIKPKTVCNIFWTLRAAVNRAVRTPTSGVDMVPWGLYCPRKPRNEGEWRRRAACGSLPQLEALIRAAIARDNANRKRGREHPADMGVRVLVLALTGLRQGEAAGLGWDRVHIDEESGQPRIEVLCQVKDQWRRKHPDWTRPKDLPKFNRQRTVALHPACADALRAHRAALQARGLYRADGPVFPGKKRDWRTHAQVVPPETMRKIATAAGLPGAERWVTHSTRHTFATLEAVSSGNLEATRLRTGHSDIRILQNYLHDAGMGERLPGSAIGELPAELLPSAPKLLPPAPSAELARAEAAVSSALVTLATDASATLVRYEPEPIQPRPKRPEAVNFVAEAEAWVARGEEEKRGRGRPAVRPQAVTLYADRIYNRTYLAAMRDTGGDKSEAKKRAAASRRATFGSWAKALKNAAAKHAAISVAEGKKAS